ncbi:transcriptional regulator YeiL [Fusibacter sp. 3D3]|uniref:transcriptional regulator YeiL n=1 Tax=Fusibacter sp. 3D3 TaxID=1048380 RepID=UPI000853EE5A|nr:transcriptional regulator YeiL [Fusibacter sp. 3D3]GAU77602.1 predicted N-ribosylNicotinamide CRP-like regulator [Fusibacter sp. 3D3]
MKRCKVEMLDSALKSKVEQYKDLFESVYPFIQVEIFEANENIVYFNEEISHLRYLIKGRAKTSLVHENGKRSIIQFVMPDEFIGELSLIDVEKQPKDVVAISECICISLAFLDVKAILLKDDKFLLALSRYIGQKLLKRTWFNSKNQNYELKNRLAAHVLMSSNKGIYQEKHTETAEFLGVSYRHLLHTFYNFQAEGLIAKQKKGYKIDAEGLAILAKDIEIGDYV